MLISGGGGVQVRRQIWLYGGCSYYGGWGSLGKALGYVDIVGDRGPGAEFGDVNIWGSVWGFGTDIGYVNIVGPGKGKGGWGTGIGDVNIGGGRLGTEMGMLILWGWGC